MKLTEQQWKEEIVTELHNLRKQIDNLQKQAVVISKALDFVCAEILRLKERKNEKNN